MSGALVLLLAEVRADRAAFAQHCAVVVGALPESGDDADLALLALSLHHAYTAVESILERIQRTLLGDVPGGPDSHRRAVDDAMLELPGVRPPLLTPASASALHDLRGFRHVVRHAYAAEYDRAKLRALVELVRGFDRSVHPDLAAIERWLEGLVAAAGR